ncbi:MAG TPA: hypothetical protein VMT52_13490 [Planctomycetota bacterium]|nr:hypothetical protein [Planctomycetota bacterium]
MRCHSASMAMAAAALALLIAARSDDGAKKDAAGLAGGIDDTKAEKDTDAPKAPEKGEEPIRLNSLEEKFASTMSGATLAGKWRLVKDGKLGEEKEDKYTIRAATKVGEDLWLIGARVQYGGKDVTVPVPVKVFWAGDTPVISITNAGLPGLGTYTARVLIYDGHYTGTWSGPGHAGFLTGLITREEAKKDS